MAMCDVHGRILGGSVLPVGRDARRGDARDDVRLWLHRALVSDDSGNDDYIVCSSSGTEPKCDMGYWGMGAIGRPDRSQDPGRNCAVKCRNKWDPLTMSQPFNLFYAFLLGLMKGNVFEYSSTGKQVSDCTESAHSLCHLIKLKAIDLVSILMSYAPRHDHLEVGDTNRTPFLWSFWLDSLTSPVLTTRQSSGGEDRTTNIAMGHGGEDAYEILAVTDGVVDAVRDAGRYASAAFT